MPRLRHSQLTLPANVLFASIVALVAYCINHHHHQRISQTRFVAKNQNQSDLVNLIIE